MKLYLAHNFEARNYLRERVDAGAFGKHEITSSWIRDGKHSDGSDRSLSALTDWQDLNRADVVVVFMEQFGEKPGKGKFWEWGAANALGKYLILVGKSDCVFWYLHPRFNNQFVVDGIEGALKIVNTLQKGVDGGA